VVVHQLLKQSHQEKEVLQQKNLLQSQSLRMMAGNNCKKRKDV
jgi:hypothetical protein